MFCLAMLDLRVGRYYLVFIQIQSDQDAALFTPECSTIVALTKGCKGAKVVRDQNDIPDGCGSAVVTPFVLIHTLVRVSLFIIISRIPRGSSEIFTGSRGS